MIIDKRIWKTAALAAVITIVGGLFIMRLDDWSKGLNSGFVAYGESGTGGGGVGGGCGSSSSGATGTATACVSKIIPHMVAGLGYRTFVEVINSGNTTVNVNADFYVPARTAAGLPAPEGTGTKSTETFTTDLNGTTGSFVGSISAVSVPVNGILVITLDKDSPIFTVNWGSIQATGPITVAAAFEVHDGGHNLLSRVGVSASAPDIKQFVIPRIRHVGRSLDVGYALVNTGSTTATITGTLRDAAGRTLMTKDLTLGPQNQIAIFTREFFGAALTETDDPSGKIAFQAMTFTSQQGQFAAVALAIEGTQLSSFPVDRLQ